MENVIIYEHEYNPITLKGKPYYYALIKHYDIKGDYVYTSTSLFSTEEFKEVKRKRKCIKRGFLGIFNNEYEYYNQITISYKWVGNVNYDIENTTRHTKEECINDLIGTLPKDYEDLDWKLKGQ